VPCDGYPGALHPDEHGVVVNGSAETDYLIYGLIEVDTHVQILPTPAMAKSAWMPWATPAFARCLRQSIASNAYSVSVSRATFPHEGSFSAKYHAVYGGLADDWILLASQCARLQLVVTGPSHPKWSLSGYELALAKLLVKKATGSCFGSA
jgi:hypothetical protein